MNVKTHPELLSDLLVGNFGTLVNDIFNDQRTAKTSGFTPRVDLLELETDYKVELSIPGMDKASIKVKQDNDLLTISGERKAEESNAKRHISEIRRGSFSRSLRLPKNALLGETSAAYTDGILTVNVPKKEETKPRLIEVK